MYSVAGYAEFGSFGDRKFVLHHGKHRRPPQDESRLSRPDALSRVKQLCWAGPMDDGPVEESTTRAVLCGLRDEDV